MQIQQQANQRSARARLANAMRQVVFYTLLLSLGIYFIPEDVRSFSSMLWCKVRPGPSCYPEPHTEGPEMARDVRTPPLANTKEMLKVLGDLSEISIQTDFEQRTHLITAAPVRPEWNVGVQDELSAGGKGAIEDWNSLVLSQNQAVFKTKAMVQHLRHQYFTLQGEALRTIPWSSALFSPSKWGRYDLRADVVTMVKDTARNVDESRKFLIGCTQSAGEMKRQVLRLQGLAKYNKKALERIREKSWCWGSCSIDSEIKEWEEFITYLDAAYYTALDMRGCCSNLDNTLSNWMTNFNNTRGLSYSIEKGSLIGPPRDPSEILDTLQSTILLLE